ncbi:hypothetical protein ACROYT_G019732 [Oculina patagonica]
MKMASFILRFAFLMLLIYQSSVALGRMTTIFISPNGRDSKGCGNSSQPCLSLDFAISLARQNGANWTQISAAKGNYSMKNSYSFTNVVNFGLVGERLNPEDVEVTCETNVSLSFILSDNIFFEGIKLHKCGGWHRSSVNAKKPYRGLDGVNFRAALDFRYCRNIRLTNVEISFSPGLGLNCYDCGGLINFTNSVFADNVALYSNTTFSNTSSASKGLSNQSIDYVYSGGGVYLALDPYGHNTVNVTPSKHDSFQHNNRYIFRNCRFLRNEAVWLNGSHERDFVDTPELPFSRGGGLAIYFRSNASGCTIGIESCVFESNRAQWGGGLMLEMKERTGDNIFTMEHSTFERNSGFLAGGGARIGNLIEEDGRRINTFTINNCSFVNNTGIWGGGTSIYGTTIPGIIDQKDVTQFFFTQCHWFDNTGTVGAAIGVFLSNQNEDQIGPEVPYHISFNDSSFLRNQVIRMEDLVTIGEGALYSVEVPLIFRGNVTFVNNTKSAAALDGSTMEIHGNLHFINNRGFRGGALAMYGRSRIIFNEDSYLLFQGNECEDKGGALYIYAPGPPLVGFNATGKNTHVCFFGYSDSSVDYDDWKTKVVFQGNKAPYYAAGNAVYATTLKNCRQAGEPRQNNSVLRWKFVEFRDANGVRISRRKEVATDPVDIEYNSADWKVAPSEVFNASVELLDEIGNSVVGVVVVKIIPQPKSSSVELYTPSPLFIANGSISYLKLAGKAGEKFSVEISYLGRQVLTETITDLSLKQCNPGFMPRNKICVCMDSTNDGIRRCKADGKTFYLQQGYWAGSVNGKFVTHFCPTGYCNFTDRNAIEHKYVPNNVCNNDRDQKSLLCGNCKANYSVLFGGESCSSTCSNWHLFLLLLYGFILLLVVMGVMLIDLDFFTGYLNAWLYSYQVMKVITPDGFTFDPFIEFVIGLANFQFKTGGGGICFAAGLDDADKLAIMYALPTYVLVLVICLARAVSNHPNWWFSKKVRAAPFRAFCTIFVLCYTDITRISLRILHPAAVGSKIVVYANGSIDFFTGKHIAYGILAILYILVVVLPFPLILLFRPSLTRRLFPVVNLNRWKPIFDALQNCFKDKFRWCAAFYFLCRFVILIIATFMPSSPIKGALLQSVCVLILLTVAFLRPYKESADVKEDEESYEWINMSDVALLATLSLIAIFSSPVDSTKSDSTRLALKVFVYVLAYIPLIVFVMVAIRCVKKWHEARKLHRELTEPEMSATDLSDITDEAAADYNQRT